MVRCGSPLSTALTQVSELPLRETGVGGTLHTFMVVDGAWGRGEMFRAYGIRQSEQQGRDRGICGLERRVLGGTYVGGRINCCI